MIAQTIPNKVILVGDCRVGKTSIFNFMLGKKTDRKRPPKPTIGVDYQPITLKLNNGESIRINIWDTTGAEEYRSITSSYYRRCKGAILVFDITDRTSFLNLNMWLEEIKKIQHPYLKIILFANKFDLTQTGQKQQQVSDQEIKSFCTKNSLEFQYTSAVTGYNIRQAMNYFIQKVQEDKTTVPPQRQVSSSPSLEVPKEQVRICSTCC